MKRGKESRKAQFYLIAAMIIVFIIIGFAAVSNYIYVKKEPQKFYDMAEILKTEGFEVGRGALYSGKNVSENIRGYLEVFESYLSTNPNENLDILIVYGSAESGDLQAVRYSTEPSEGGVSLSLGGASFLSETGGKIKKEDFKINSKSPNAVNITLIGQETNITDEFAVLPDSNFIFMMTTSDEFSTYIKNSQTP